MGVNRERGESLVRNVLLFCVLRDDVFEDSWGENRGVLEKAEKYFFLKTCFISGIRLSQREREREMNARRREREKGKERRDYLNVDI